MLFSCIALWESGMLKAYPEPNIEVENPILGDLQSARQKYQASTMPYLVQGSMVRRYCWQSDERPGNP